MREWKTRIKRKKGRRKKGEASIENVVFKKKNIFFQVAVLER